MMKNNFRLGILLGSLLVLTNCVNLKQRDLAKSNPITTMINLSAIQDDQVPVTIDPGRFVSDTVLFHLPKVIQGTYAVSDFGKFISQLKAWDYKGKQIRIQKKDKNTWLLTPAKDIDKITYLVNDTFDVETENNGDPFSPSGTNIEPSNVMLNLHGFVGYFDSLKNNQYSLYVQYPSSMKRSASLQLIGTTSSADGKTKKDKYFASRYFEIIDNPIFYGDLDIEVFTVDDIKITLSVYSPNKVYSAASIKATIFKMMQAQKRYLGEIDSTPSYGIYLYLSDGEDKSPRGYGALEHHTSTVVVLPEQMTKEALEEAIIDVVSHEFFHIVTPLSVHSEDIHYFDYNSPSFSKHLWMYEGVTEYFATIFQVKQDLVGEEQFFTKIMSKIEASKKFDDRMSFFTMSENILEEPYAKNYINVYQKGALIGMCIDLIMREKSGGDRGILSLMKALSDKYGRNKPFEDDTLIDEITALTYPEVGNFLQQHVAGKNPIPYEKYFDKVGLKIQKEKVKTNYIQNVNELIIGVDQNLGIVFFTPQVVDNSFWSDLGIQAYDIIESINQTKIELSTVNNFLSDTQNWKEGEDLEIVINRKGKQQTLKTKITQSYTIADVLVSNPQASAAQNTLRRAWIKG